MRAGVAVCGVDTCVGRLFEVVVCGVHTFVGRLLRWLSAVCVQVLQCVVYIQVLATY